MPHDDHPAPSAATSPAPSGVTVADAASRAEILALEERRRDALVAGDVDALDAMFDDALVHVHAPGLVHTKAQLLEHVATRRAYVDVVRDDLLVRLVGDVGVVTGRIVNHMRGPDGAPRVLAGVVTQVVVRGDDGAWRFVSFQMTPDGEQVWGALPSQQQAPAEDTKDGNDR
ncbi:nuclear transport factor 2 family protein [Isoptericola sp. NPDC058082]|uniref:nuclear transport factor 2 family protein n=1 Tax=Isoptericola sp. NPDC058082 TaxID=3346331 RepID=UPI0036EEEC92